MRKASILILVCWIVFGFLLYLGYGEIYELPQIDLPTEYAYLPEALGTQTSAIVFLISGLVLGLVSYAAIFPEKTRPNKDLPPYIPVKDVMKTYGTEYSTHRKSTSSIESKMGVAIIDGVTKYSRRFTQSPAALEKRVSEYSKEEAWTILRDDFWDTKRKSLGKFQPETLQEILYWETHLDEYFVYMNMKLLFGIPYLEQDFWVRRS